MLKYTYNENLNTYIDAATKKQEIAAVVELLKNADKLEPKKGLRLARTVTNCQKYYLR